MLTRMFQSGYSVCEGLMGLSPSLFTTKFTRFDNSYYNWTAALCPKNDLFRNCLLSLKNTWDLLQLEYRNFPLAYLICIVGLSTTIPIVCADGNYDIATTLT